MRYLKTFESYSINEEEGLRKFFTGHESGESRDKAMMDFMKALDEAEAAANEDPEGYYFKRDILERQAKENNYLGGLRTQLNRRDGKIWVVYDKGVTGFEDLASSAGGETNIRK